MASGTWQPSDKPKRPGFYMRFIAAALARIQPGARGIVAIPVKASWGPKKQVLEITGEKDLIDILGTDTGGDFTAYTCVRLCLLGQPKTILVYSLSDGSELQASIALKDTAVPPVDVLRLKTKYPTSKDFKVTVRTNILDENKQDIVLYEGSKQLFVYTFDKGAAVIDNALAAVNDNKDNKWLVAEKIATGNGTLATISSQNLTGGNAGVANITNADYIDAMAVFESRLFHGFTLDGVTDASLLTSAKAWIERLRNEGKKCIGCFGSDETTDEDISNAITRSKAWNHEGIVNVGIGGELGDVWYPSAFVACWVTGKCAGQALKESLTYAVTPFTDVYPRLTHNQVVAALAAGVLVLVHDGEKVVIEQGINTLSSLRVDMDNQWKKIKIIRIMDAIDMDTAKAGHDSYIGKVLNNDDGQTAVLTAIKKYFETLVPDLLDPDFTVEVDTDLQQNAENDEFFWKYGAKIIDSMEKIYGTGYLR